MADRKADLERRKVIVSSIIRDERIRRQQSQKEFAAFIGLEIDDQPLVSKWELAKTLPWPGDAELLSQATGIHALAFLGFPYAHAAEPHGATVTVVGNIGGPPRQDIYLPPEKQESFNMPKDDDRDLTAKVFHVDGGSLSPSYVEGDYIYIAWPEGGRDSIKDGDHVAFAVVEADKNVRVSIMEYHVMNKDNPWDDLLRELPGRRDGRDPIPARSVNMLGVVTGKLSLFAGKKQTK